MAIITILLATYNGEAYIREMIDSVLGQDCENWKLILSDDCSQDHTPKILEEYAQHYPQKIEYYRSGLHFGSAQAHFMHLLSRYRDAEYIMFADQDDVWHKDKVSKTFLKMRQTEEENRQPVLVFTDLCVVDTDLKTINTSFMRQMSLNGNRTELRYLLVQNIIAGCTVMINRSLSLLASEDIPNHECIMHDWWLGLIASAFGKVVFFDEVTIDYRQHGNNAMGAKDVRSMNYIAERIKTAGFRKDTVATYRQATVFYEVFSSKMNSETARLVSDYAEMQNAGKLKRLVTLIKGGYWKYGIIRNLLQLFCG